jgi:transposase
MDMRMIKDVLRLKLHGRLSHEAVARSLSISKGVVAKYVSLATASGLQNWESVASLVEAELERRLFGAGPEQRRVVEPDFGRIHLELRRKGVTLTLLWEEYRAANEGRRTWGLTQFCEHYKAYTKTLRRSMRQQHRAGEKLFVDYAGPTLELADGGRGQVFVAAMGASSYTFACVTADQSMRSWLGAIGRTLRCLGGVPQMIVPDNARALIADPNRYEPRATTRCWTSPATTTCRSCPRAPTRRRTRPRSSRRCRSWSGGSWRGCATFGSPTCWPPTRRCKSCCRCSTAGACRS